MVDHELVSLFGDEEVDLDVTVAGGGDGLEQRLVRDEVGRTHHQFLLGVVHDRIEHAQVGLGGVAGAGGDELEVVGVIVHGIVIGLHVEGNLFLGFQVPVHREDRDK